MCHSDFLAWYLHIRLYVGTIKAITEWKLLDLIAASTGIAFRGCLNRQIPAAHQQHVANKKVSTCYPARYFLNSILNLVSHCFSSTQFFLQSKVKSYKKDYSGKKDNGQHLGTIFKLLCSLSKYTLYYIFITISHLYYSFFHQWKNSAIIININPRLYVYSICIFIWSYYRII